MGDQKIDTSHKLRHGQALSLQYALFILTKLSRCPKSIRSLFHGIRTVGDGDPAEMAGLGCFYATQIMVPFVAELAIKALIEKHGNNKAPNTHNLRVLHDNLSQELRDAVEQEFKKIKHSHETRSASDILGQHTMDFPGWRYLDSPEQIQTDPLDSLQFITYAVLTVYNER